MSTKHARQSARGPESDAAVRDPWRRRTTVLVVPLWVARAMFERARKWNLLEGGRFEPRNESIVLWSGRQPWQPVGWFAVRWGSPAADQATIRQVAWHPDRGGSLEEVCRAIELLAGVS